MKRRKSLLALACISVSCAIYAQDDMYFMPKASDVAQKKENKETVSPTYYSGSDRDVDEYNRRGYVGDGGMASNDSTASDVFYMQSDETYLDSMAGVEGSDYAIDADDYEYCRRLSRFDDYYLYGAPWRDPYYGFYGYYSPYWYSAWFAASPYYYDWYFAPYYYGWYYPWGWHHHYHPAWGAPHYAYNGITGTSNHGSVGYGHSRGGNLYGFRGNRSGSKGSLNGNRSHANRKYKTYKNDSRYNGNRKENNYQNKPFNNNRNNSSYNSSSFGGSRGGGSSFGGSRGGSSFGGSRGGGSFGGGRRR